MKKIMSFFAVIVLCGVSSVRATMLEDWTNESGSNTGSYLDSKGSKMAITTEAGPQAGQTALKLTYTLMAGGNCGVWHNLANDLSKESYLKFMAKAAVACNEGIALKDANNVQYVATYPVGTAWAQVNIPFASFKKDPYYTPSDAVLGHPMDLTHTTSMNFQPGVTGTNVLWIGPIETAQGTAPAQAAVAASGSASGGSVVVQDFSTLDDKSAGAFPTDSQGSSFVFKVKDNANKPGSKFMVVKYDLKKSGNCGMWCRAGSDWSGVDMSSAKSFNLTVYSAAPIVIGLAMKDKNNNQYVASAPATKGGVWETLSVPLSSFSLDPYFTPPDAVKGAPKDFSKVGTFNIQPKTEGTFTFAVSSVVAQ